MKYKVLTTYEPSDLSKAVEALLKDGWKLQGGVAMVDTGAETHEIMLAQAMVKSEHPVVTPMHGSKRR